ncbi:glycogen synthesis protein GlgS [Franconibacter pulveris 601]|uniref:hypothetical protein n=1 Tax=Franconibacter TaxID=1649295 RepID=UPI000463DB00|nr:hypothetical protein [Franconibacter pulveris]
MQSIEQQSIMLSGNFDFLARSFAQMCVHGRQFDIDTITGNMDSDSRVWFVKRYQFYLSYLASQH